MKGPWRHPSFRWLYLGRNIDALGNGVAPVALAFAVLDLTGSKVALGIVVAARSVTNVALLLFGGVVADRFRRERVAVVAASMAALSQSAVAGLVLTGSAQVWSLAAISAVNGAAAALALPASSAMLPQIVDAGDLPKANALLRVGLNLAGLLGVAAGVQLVAAVGPGWGIAVDAASFAVSALAFSRVQPSPAMPQERATVLADLLDGWSEFTRRRWVWIVVAQFAVVNAASSGVRGVLAPVVADQTFGRQAYGWILTIFSLGLLAGSLLALKIRPRRTLLYGVSVILLLALPPLALAVSPTVVPVALAFFITALAYDQFGVAWDLSLQQNVSSDKLARVYSYDMVGSLAAVPIGQVLVGPLAQAFGTERTLLVCASAIVLATLLAISDPSVRGLVTHSQEAISGEPDVAS